MLALGFGWFMGRQKDNAVYIQHYLVGETISHYAYG